MTFSPLQLAKLTLFQQGFNALFYIDMGAIYLSTLPGPVLKVFEFFCFAIVWFEIFLFSNFPVLLIFSFRTF